MLLDPKCATAMPACPVPSVVPLSTTVVTGVTLALRIVESAISTTSRPPRLALIPSSRDIIVEVGTCRFPFIDSTVSNIPHPGPAADTDPEFRRLKETLSALANLRQPDLRAMSATIAETVADALEVERVTLWRYNPQQSSLSCAGAWQNGAWGPETMVVNESLHPIYWRWLHQDRTLSVTDAQNDPALVEFKADYIDVHGIGALLDTSVRAGGHTYGIVCAEHLGGPREWTALERMFVASVGDRIGLAILLDVQRQMEQHLAQAQKLEALGLMAGGLAHDFNNVLSVVLASSELALSSLSAAEPAIEDAKEDLEAIRDAAKRATGMTRRLLTVARREPMTMTAVELNAVLRDIMPIAQRLLPRHIVLSLSLAPTHLWLQADRAFLDQALINLLTNAAQSIPDAGTVTLETAPVHSEGEAMFGMVVPPGHYVRLSVHDTGAGVDAELLTKIFDPFFTTKGQRGTGLGLAVVYGGMQQHGGIVGVKSEVNEGCTFHLLFPANAA